MIELFESSLRLSTPLIFAALGGLLCERSGVATICLEGVLLVSAFFAASADVFFHNPELGLVIGMGAGGLLMVLHAFLTQRAQANAFISGVVINILAMGLTPLLSQAWFGSSTNTPSLPAEDRLNGSLLIFISLVLPLLVQILLYHTRFGLRLRSAGDGPRALTTAGVSVTRIRFLALFCGGILTSMGGAYLSIAHSSQFLRDMSAGKGFIALAAIIFGKWKPIPVFFAALFFGFTQALPLVLQTVQWNGWSLPVQWIQMIPYVLTLIILISAVGSAHPPRAIGEESS